MRLPRRWALVAVVVLGTSACGSSDGPGLDSQAVPDTAPTSVAVDASALSSTDVPDLPFADNPDPTKCGIPTPWGDGGRAWLTGIWQGDLIQPEVLLYDSHQRFDITGQGAHGAEVEIILYQANPVLDYYLVELADGSGESGWVPAPFLSFEPVSGT